jgi:signal transduction histidine kinase
VAGWILESFRSGIVAVDGEGDVLTLNGGAQRILGCPVGPVADALGRNCRQVLDAQPGLAQLLMDALGRNRRLSRAELALEAVGDRPPITIGFTLLPVSDGTGGARGAAVIFRDLTPVERADEQARLRERLAALGEMAAGLAHEIRNPLAGMKVVVDLLLRRMDDRPEECALLGELSGELASLTRTVADCLDFVRPVSVVLSPVDPVALVEASLTVARSHVAYRGAIERDYSDRLPTVVADGDQLRAVVANLIVNAFEAMGSDGPHRLTLGLAGGMVETDGQSGSDGEGPVRELVISVSDTGPGVAPEHRDKVFYPFFTTKQRGSGVGLATAQKIVGSHGGAIDLESLEGGGCTFRIRLPAVSAARGSGQAA